MLYELRLLVNCLIAMTALSAAIAFVAHLGGQEITLSEPCAIEARQQ